MPISSTARPSEAHVTALDLKSVADDGVFEGYASLFNAEDLSRDVILPGAFRDTLRERGAGGVRLLFQHNPAEPIGVWDSLVEDHKGLRARGRLMTTVARAREVLALMRAGAIDGLSIGFKAVKSRRDAATRVRIIEKVDLWEISIVTFPMLPEARVFTVAPSHIRAAPALTPATHRPPPSGIDDLAATATRLASRIERHAASPASPHVIAARLAGDRALASLIRLGLMELKRDSLKANFHPGQLRVPGGNGRDSGTWARPRDAGGLDGLVHLVGGRLKPLAPSDITALYRSNGGHHVVPLAEAKLRSNVLSPDAVDVLSRSTIGSGGELKNQSDPDNPHRGRSAAHREHDKAAKEIAERFIKDNKITAANPMTRQQAHRLVDEVQNSKDPRIRSFHTALRNYMKELSPEGRKRRFRGGGRGRE